MTSKTYPKNVAVVGCGHWGRNLIRNFAKLGALRAVSDVNPQIAQTEAAKYEAEALDFPGLLGRDDITAIVLATPAETHYKLAHKCLLAGKHVFVEKPLSLNLAEADELCRLAEGQGRQLMVGHLMQYHPAFLKLKALCDEGRLGRIQYIYSHRLNLGRIRSEENILWSFAPHDISMILSLFNNEPETVSAQGHCYLHNVIADVTTTNLTFKSGQAAHIFVSWLHPFKEQRLVVIGQQGMASFDDTRDWPEKLLLYPHAIHWKDGIPVHDKAEAIAVPLEQAEPLSEECRHFLDCVATGTRPRTDGGEGLRVLRVLDAAQRSMSDGKTGQLAPAIFPGTRIHEFAIIDQPAEIGEGTAIWHFSHVLGGSRIGKKCNIGQNVVIGPNVTIGDQCKIQNNVSVYTGVTVEDGVFLGPSMVFTNVLTPRARINRKDQYLPTLLKEGATVGANATIVCGNTIGRYALIGAGAVVTRDVPDYALMAGNPARRIGWACECGVPLPKSDWTETSCPDCKSRYRLANGNVEKLP